MYGLSDFLFFVGKVLMAVGGIWLLIRAFRVNHIWGRLCIVPFVNLIAGPMFIIKHWSLAKRPLWTLALGASMCLAGDGVVSMAAKADGTPPAAALAVAAQSQEAPAEDGSDAAKPASTALDRIALATQQVAALGRQAEQKERERRQSERNQEILRRAEKTRQRKEAYRRRQEEYKKRREADAAKRRKAREARLAARKAAREAQRKKWEAEQRRRKNGTISYTFVDPQSGTVLKHSDEP